jgi:hypothetical protein
LRQKERKEVGLPRGFSEVKWPWKMKSLPGAGRADIKEKEIKRYEIEGKRENRGLRNIVGSLL